jgi:catechol 2,3-dioxygenase-like lactoylglutathione lyase family enzyme
MIRAGRVDFIAVPTSDLARSDEFYGTLGLARNPNSSGERWVEYETGNLTIAVSQFGGAVALGVADVDDGRRKLEEHGVEFHGETFDSGVCNGAPSGRKQAPPASAVRPARAVRRAAERCPAGRLRRRERDRPPAGR